jgi:glycerol kinase
MPDDRLILALDQGTTSSRAIAFDRRGTPVAVAQREFPQGFPSPGHVTHDPEDIWSSQLAVARDVVAAVGGADRIAAIGLTNQRETTVVWDRSTGRPVAPAIVWQSRITSPFCEQLRADGAEPLIRARTGLPVDAYFSGPKIRHILREGGLQARAREGELAFGTVDTFLVWRLTGGRLHATDVSNASRTMLLDIGRCEWDDELLRLIEVPSAVLPQVRPSSAVWAETDPAVFGRAIPIAGVAGDQQAATFGQACFEHGEAKNTYGTGAFLVLNTGEQPVPSEHGLLTTVLWRLGETGRVAYALEGSVFIAGAAVQWLRDGLRAIDSSDGIDALIGGLEDTGGVYFVPAFVGLGAPHWDPDARGVLVGLTRGTGLPEIARATLESIAYQVRDVVEAMTADRGEPLTELRVDGGAARNDVLLAFQADVLGVPVERPTVTETTAWGAAALAGLAIGWWGGLAELAAIRRVDRRFEPSMDDARRARLVRDWDRAVERAKGWATPD